MTSKQQLDRLERLEAEDAALEQRITKLESQIEQLRRQGQIAYRSKNIRAAKEKARCLKVLGKQLDQLSAMKINIFECLQTEQMRQFVEGYAKAITPVDAQGHALSIEAAQANIDGTVDFMEEVNELTDVIADATITGTSQPDVDDLESLFGAFDDIEAGSAASGPGNVSDSQASVDIGAFPTVPTASMPTGSGSKPPPPTQAEALLEEHLSLIN